MPNGKSGDHPLTDLLVHKSNVYDTQTDDLIRKIARLSSSRELNEWWEKEIGWHPDLKTIHQKANTRYQELLNRSKQSGWEKPE